jgi:hypothetical protein
MLLTVQLLTQGAKKKDKLVFSYQFLVFVVLVRVFFTAVLPTHLTPALLYPEMGLVDWSSGSLGDNAEYSEYCC